MAEFNFPTEEIELPSKGLVYPKEHPLSSGKVEMKYMTAKEEDILSNQSYIQKGTVLDKLLQSLIISKGVKVDDLIVGDKNALLIASRILGYGKEYEFEYDGITESVDLTELENRPIDEKSFNNKNEFSYKFKSSGNEITYKLITGKDDKLIKRELEGYKKINKEASPELTTRLKRIILSVNGDDDQKTIREFVDNYLLAKESRELREHILSTQPDVDLNIVTSGGKEVAIPIGLRFFWPDF
jgi:hypothetical protein